MSAKAQSIYVSADEKRQHSQNQLNQVQKLKETDLILCCIVLCWQSVEGDAPTDAQRRCSRSRACSSARSAARSACACHPARTGTSKSALATTTGRPRGVALNAHEVTRVAGNLLSYYKIISTIFRHFC